MENTQNDNLDTKFGAINSRFDDLIDFLGEQFENIKIQFDSVNIRFDGVKGQFAEVKSELGEIKGRLTRLEDGQDKVWHEIVELRQENKVGAYRVGRVEDWVIKAAKKIHLPYNP